MAKPDDALSKRLLHTFREEARERAQTMAKGLLAWESCPSGSERRHLLEAIFRDAHSLKGAARVVSLGVLEQFCQLLETIFASLKGDDSALTPAVLASLQQAALSLHRMLENADIASLQLDAEQRQLVSQLQQFASATKTVRTSTNPNTATNTSAGPGAGPTPELVATLPAETSAAPVDQSAAPATVATAEPNAGPNAVQGADAGPEPGSARPRELSWSPTMLRIAASKLDAILFHGEELLNAKLSAQELSRELKALYTQLQQLSKRQHKLAVAGQGARRASTLASTGTGLLGSGPDKPGKSGPGTGAAALGEQLAALTGRCQSLARTAESQQRAFSALTDKLQEEVKSALMLPCSVLFELFPSVVRDLANQQRKDIDFQIRGELLEIDKRVMDEIKTPMLHLLRNAIDHGIESAEERRLARKPVRGKVTVTLMNHEGGKAEFLIEDDGRGFDAGKLRAAALKQGLLTPAAADALSEQEAFALAFESGISTSPMLTDLSGRGLGLAIVREKIERLGGSLSVHSQPGQGCRFRLLLPLSLSTFRGLLLGLAEQLFILPVTHLERVVRVPWAEIRTLENRESVQLGGQTVALARMGEVLGLPVGQRERKASAMVALVVVAVADKRIAFLVDEVFGDQEVSVKTLGRQLQRLNNILGATVLGNGRVVPIINVADLLKSAIRLAATGTSAWRSADSTAPAKAVLVVEDSITSRALLKNILEVAGYLVSTAVDGEDAWQFLQQNAIDLIVSDVEMPNLNGFELTRRVRADAKLNALPVVLVTALHSAEDRERGLDAGANAYIVKSTFDQDNLLAAVARLI